MHVLIRHMASHVSSCMGFDLCINGGVHNQFIEGEKRKGKKRKGGNERKGKQEKREGKERKERKRKRKRKRERGRRPAVSSSVHWRFDGRKSLNKRVKFEDSTRGEASRGRETSYFGLFLAFGQLFWTNFGTVLCHVNGMGRVCSRFIGLLLKRIWVENLHLRELPKFSCNPRARYCMDWSNSVAHGILLLRTTIFFSSKLRFTRSWTL